MAQYDIDKAIDVLISSDSPEEIDTKVGKALGSRIPYVTKDVARCVQIVRSRYPHAEVRITIGKVGASCRIIDTRDDWEPAGLVHTAIHGKVQHAVLLALMHRMRDELDPVGEEAA